MAPRYRQEPRFLTDDKGKPTYPLFTPEQIAGETDYPLARANQVALLTNGMKRALGVDSFDLGDNDQEKPRGKLLVQYHPVKNYSEQAAWRVWFEGRPLDGQTAAWAPEAGRDQIFIRDGGQGGLGRREECLINIPSATTSGGTETSTAASSTETTTISTTSTASSGPLSSIVVISFPTNLFTGISEISTTTTAWEPPFSFPPIPTGFDSITTTEAESTTSAEQITSTTEAPVETSASPPNLECSTFDDCDDWDWKCASDNNMVTCSATDWHTVIGVPTSGRAICACNQER
ncbi:hypothetical protein B0J13DRAFT_525608 [Dactylonectria estremocensis]|uniref:Uncharacterized protein n=1 Tax=Dactylonectria estremocensis TaxID=1079267 RepID=A0A9P9EUK6_9HYPO|nr:hypothetical protein B0J13DRAFT_525608 [Dactylonectria estremocensis]